MRAVIEKDYAQALLKLATSHLQKKGGPESKLKDGESHNTVYGVWRTLLDETEKIAKARLAATEVYQQQVSEGAKSLRLYKLQVAKKFSFRREACDIQATKARNDYVLALIAANAHQTKFYENDLPDLVQASKQHTMECFFHDNSVLSQTILYEFEPCDNDQINKLSIEHNAALCLSKEARRWISCVAKEVRVIRDSQDELKKLLAQIGDKHPYTLQSDQIGPQAELEARIDELRQIIRKSQTSKKKAEARLEAMKEAGVNVEDWVKTSDTDSVSASDSPAEIFSRSGTVTSRSSRQSYQSNEVFEGSVEVNDAAFYDSDTAEPTPVAADTVADTSYMPDLTSAVDVVAAVQEAWDAAAETEEIEEPEPTPPPPTATVQEPVVNGEVPASVPGQRCVALFSYEATNSDELSFVEQEELELINEGDGDGWVMARNYRGEEGYIPQNYVEVVESQAAEASSRPPLTSFSSVDYTMPSEDKEAGIDVDSQPAPDDTTEVAPISELATTEIQRPTQLPYDERISCCQALYDYEATCDEELSFYEGQIIKILRKKVCDVDDGWWEGELDGQVGLFPSLVVEELKENGEPLTPSTPLSPPEAPPPPAFTPPEAQLIIPPAAVILTQPTPEIEHPGAEPQAAETTNNYAPLVSSPDSPTKTMAENLKEEVKESDMKEEINSEITSPSVGTDDCPTVVITSITGGDTPVSDDDMEIKDETPAAASSEVPEKDVTASTSSGPGKDTASFSAVGDKDGAVSSAPEKNAADAFGANPDAFECSFDDDFASQHIPQEFPVAKKETSKEPEPVKMEINGTDKTQSLSSDGNQDFFSGVAEGSETTG
ncbi:protein nervous wreck [Trichonephila inaurata madagascariensis]|uniref:Protein nervous wreck n=1 Tax=Trichonephila inaurata madagascariensis TaxID=2747483 RepID=A0A8X6WUM3_9ARAC|nr:protein nervous wreck [Trichonephila inaurata madagascariensis]